MENSKISWTHHTFNPWWGCEKVSPACNLCYAEAFAKRAGHMVWGGPNTERRFFPDKHWNEPLKWNHQAVESGERKRVFCASMADVFEDREDLITHRARLYNLIRQTPNLDWLLLTKRPENWEKHTEEVYQHWKRSNDGDRHFVDSWIASWQGGNYPHNVWIGATAEDQDNAVRRKAALLRIPAAVRFLSMEPLLGYVELGALDRIDWVIVGGESGPEKTRRDLDMAALYSVAAQCKVAGVPVHVKQDSGRYPGQQGRIPDALWKRKEFPTVKPKWA